MALIQQLDPLYADFTQSSSDLRRLRQAMAAGQLVATAPNEAQVTLFFDDGTQYEHPGKLLFSEATVDTTTGQVLLRGEFPNPNGELLPGLYVRVRIEQAIRDNALAIPQMAVLRDAQGNAQVYVVRDDDTVELRTLQLGPTIGNRWIVDGGLQAGERVVVVGSRSFSRMPGRAAAVVAGRKRRELRTSDAAFLHQEARLRLGDRDFHRARRCAGAALHPDLAISPRRSAADPDFNQLYRRLAGGNLPVRRSSHRGRAERHQRDHVFRIHLGYLRPDRDHRHLHPGNGCRQCAGGRAERGCPRAAAPALAGREPGDHRAGGRCGLPAHGRADLHRQQL